MTPSKDLALSFLSDDELMDDHNETFSQVKLRMNDDEDDGEEKELTSHPEQMSRSPQNNVESAEEALEEVEPGKMNGDANLKSISERTAVLTLRTSQGKDDVPRISITPMTPGSISPEPDDGHSTVSLNSSGGSPLFQNQKYHGQMSMSPNLYWRPQSPMPPKNDTEAKEFFAYRDSIVANVLEEVGTLVDETDGGVHGTWLLTE